MGKLIYTIELSANEHYFIDFTDYTEEEREIILNPPGCTSRKPKVLQIARDGDLFVEAEPPSEIFYAYDLVLYIGNATLQDWVKKIPIDLLKRLYEDHIRVRNLKPGGVVWQYLVAQSKNIKFENYIKSVLNSELSERDKIHNIVEEAKTVYGLSQK